MFKISIATAAALVCLTAGAASAQTRLPDVLQNAAEARAGVQDGRDPKSPWVLEQYGDVSGKGCTLYHLTAKEMMIIVGPTDKGIFTEDRNESALLLAGPDIPKPQGEKFQAQRVTLKIDGFPVATIKGVLIADSPLGKGGTLMLYSKTLEEGLMVLRDQQTFTVEIDGKPIYNTSWTGATAQVTKLRACVAGNPT
ncbi:MAG: hypothetical protein J0M19_10595 [Sphingomonadales bacterium]|nr:hypothetical protein [Sphingomonadales bacterium]